jgi:hypothetical protein
MSHLRISRASALAFAGAAILTFAPFGARASNQTTLKITGTVVAACGIVANPSAVTFTWDPVNKLNPLSNIVPITWACDSSSVSFTAQSSNGNGGGWAAPEQSNPDSVVSYQLFAGNTSNACSTALTNGTTYAGQPQNGTKYLCAQALASNSQLLNAGTDYLDEVTITLNVT